MKKSGFLKNVLDTIRPQSGPANGSSQTGVGSPEVSTASGGHELRPQHLALGVVARHGFPERPSAFAYDPVQRLAALGTGSGALRVFGRPGAECWAQHAAGAPVTHIRFVVNQGALVTVTADGALHLWSLRGPELKLQFAAASTTATGLITPGSNSPLPSGGGALTPAQQVSREPTPVAGARASASTPAAGVDSPRGVAATLDETVGGGGGNGSASGDSKKPICLHTLRFQQREQITCLHQTLQSKWIYLGTRRGNVHVVNAETFQLSGYTIPWNKAIELEQRHHPGPIKHLSECPCDSNKLLIGYQTGCIVLWDLAKRAAECRFQWPAAGELRSIAWQPEGKQFVAAHVDGSLVTWMARTQGRPAQVINPSADQQQQQDPTSDADVQQSSAIDKVEWRCNKANEQTIVFARERSLTVLQPGRAAMRSVETSAQIVDFILISEASPHETEPADLQTCLVLLTNQIKALDLSPNSPNYLRWLECPIASSHLIESPVTGIQYLADCQQDLVPLLYSAGLAGCTPRSPQTKQPATGSLSNKLQPDQQQQQQWPINGGEWSQSAQSYSELVITGHLDGSIKFWEASGVNFDLIASLSTSHLFQLDQLQRYQQQQWLAIELIEYCSDARRLLLAGAGCQVLQFRLKRDSTTSGGGGSDTKVVQVPAAQTPSNSGQCWFPFTCSIGGGAVNPRRPASSLKAHFQPELLCLTGVALERCQPPKVTALELQPEHNILAYAHEDGLALIDTIQKSVILSSSLSQLTSGSPPAPLPPGALPAAGESRIAPLACGLQSGVTPAAGAAQTNSVAASLEASRRSAEIKRIWHNGLARTNGDHGGNNNAQLPRDANSAGCIQAQEAPALQLGAKSSVELRQQKQHASQVQETTATTTTAKQPPQSRFTTNSMFQRQLSSAALVRSQEGPPTRLFRRQMTSAQLPATGLKSAAASSASSASATTVQPAQNGQPAAASRLRAAALLAAARRAQADVLISSGVVSGAASQHGKDLGAPPNDPRRAATSTTGKQRIISRMLSISSRGGGDSGVHEQQAIHAEMGSVGDSAACLARKRARGGNNWDRARRRRRQRPRDVEASAAALSNRAPSAEPIDSSFVRSRSSSAGEGPAAAVPTCGSGGGCDDLAATASGQEQQTNQQPTGGSIQCLCFLDWRSAMPAPQPQSPLLAGHSADWTLSAAPTANELASACNSSNNTSGAASGNSNKSPRNSTDKSPHQLTLWLGTSQGYLVPVQLTMPDTEDNRELQLQSVLAEPAPQAITRHTGSIMCLSSFITSDTYKDPAAAAATSGTFSQFLAVVSEKEAKVFQVSTNPRDWHPSRLAQSSSLIGSTQLSDSSYACRSGLIQWSQPSGCYSLVSYLATGSLVVHSLPRLAPLLELDFVPYSHQLVATSMRFSRQGHALYQPSQGELCKFTLSSQYAALINDMTGALYAPREMPEVQTRVCGQFFKSLLAATNLATAGKQSARDELFAETSGSRSLAKHFSGLDKLRQTATGGVGGDEFRIARENLDERGEKLSEIEDRTYQMMNQSESYAQTANQLAQKFKDKKWYQF